MLFRNPQALPFLLVGIGLGLLGYYGEDWYRLPAWTEQDIEESVELNLAIDLQRMGPHLRPEGEKLERLREMVRAEVKGEIAGERRRLERWMGLGLILTVLGAGQLVRLALRPRP